MFFLTQFPALIPALSNVQFDVCMHICMCLPLGNGLSTPTCHSGKVLRYQKVSMYHLTFKHFQMHSKLRNTSRHSISPLTLFVEPLLSPSYVGS